MTVLDWVVAQRGVVHRRDLAARFTDHRVAAAIRSGALVAVGRAWVAAAGAEPILLLAAQLGGRVACTSAARILGLWTLADDHPHIAISPRAKTPARSDVRLHRTLPLAPVRRTALVESVVDVLGHVAVCLDRERALAVWESALRTGLVLPGAVGAIGWRSRMARELAAAAGVLSDSGLETLVAERLRALGLRLVQQAVVLGHRVDLLVGDRLVLQIDGWEFHSRAADRARDNRHDARLRAAGYTVIRIGYAEVVHGWAAIEAEISLAVAQGAHLARRSVAEGWMAR